MSCSSSGPSPLPLLSHVSPTKWSSLLGSHRMSCSDSSVCLLASVISNFGFNLYITYLHPLCSPERIFFHVLSSCWIPPVSCLHPTLLSVNTLCRHFITSGSANTFDNSVCNCTRNFLPFSSYLHDVSPNFPVHGNVLPFFLR